MNTYDGIAGKYQTVTSTDPIKKYSQRPTFLSILGNINHLSILDIGCGNGGFDAMLANKGASVTGYDPSHEQVALARASCPKGTFFVADQNSFFIETRFDAAISVLVLMYSQNPEELHRFFASAHNHLKPQKPFVGIVYNDQFSLFGTPYYRRLWERLPHDLIRVNFLDEAKNIITTTPPTRHILKAEYETAARKAGFRKMDWRPLIISKAGLNLLGATYWEEYIQDCPYSCFIASS